MRVKLWRAQRTYATGSPQQVPDNVFMREMRAWFVSYPDKPLNLPSKTMPPPGPERYTEAIRRAPPELARLDRYEARALARRNRALRALLRGSKMSATRILAERTQF